MAKRPRDKDGDVEMPMLNLGKGYTIDPKSGRKYIDSKPDEDWSAEAIQQQQVDAKKKKEQFHLDYEAAEKRVPLEVRKRALAVEAMQILQIDRGELG